MSSIYFYTYYTYEPFGRGYIGSRGSKIEPEKDPYLGSWSDPFFNPSEKIVISYHSTRREALEAEIALHNFFRVDENPHFANRAKASTSGLCSHGMIRINNGFQERLVHPEKIPTGWKKGRLRDPNTYVPQAGLSGEQHPHTGKNFQAFKKDVMENPAILLFSIRELGRRYETSHTSIRRWKKMLDRS